jgi:hypothetical protein
LLCAAFAYLYLSGPVAPAHANSVIDEVMRMDLPELVTGRTDFAKNDGVSIWYESVEPARRSRASILLIMACLCVAAVLLAAVVPATCGLLLVVLIPIYLLVVADCRMHRRQAEIGPPPLRSGFLSLSRSRAPPLV